LQQVSYVYPGLGAVSLDVLVVEDNQIIVANANAGKCSVMNELGNPFPILSGSGGDFPLIVIVGETTLLGKLSYPARIVYMNMTVVDNS
jgi:hypothetical protein